MKQYTPKFGEIFDFSKMKICCHPYTGFIYLFDDNDNYGSDYFSDDYLIHLTDDDGNPIDINSNNIGL
jgi:hypothetical protein